MSEAHAYTYDAICALYKQARKEQLALQRSPHTTYYHAGNVNPLERATSFLFDMHRSVSENDSGERTDLASFNRSQQQNVASMFLGVCTTHIKNLEVIWGLTDDDKFGPIVQGWRDMRKAFPILCRWNVARSELIARARVKTYIYPYEMLQDLYRKVRQEQKSALELHKAGQRFGTQQARDFVNLIYYGIKAAKFPKNLRYRVWPILDFNRFIEQQRGWIVSTYEQICDRLLKDLAMPGSIVTSDMESDRADLLHECDCMRSVFRFQKPRNSSRTTSS